jgi:nitrite reductase/ring-hydroxylating ferredoxin subunit
MFFKKKIIQRKAFDSLETAQDVLKLDEPFYLISEGKSFCFVRTLEGIFAFDDRCPHQGASLSGGYCLKGNIVCPWHHYAFDIKTGRQTSGGGDYVKTYKVITTEKGVFIEEEKTVFSFFN